MPLFAGQNASLPAKNGCWTTIAIMSAKQGSGLGIRIGNRGSWNDFHRIVMDHYNSHCVAKTGGNRRISAGC